MYLCCLYFIILYILVFYYLLILQLCYRMSRILVSSVSINFIIIIMTQMLVATQTIRTIAI